MHSQNAIRSYLAKRTGFHVHFTPTSVSWINLVERWFAALIEKQIRRGVHRSFRELEATIKDYLALTNASPRPFIWAKTADEILTSLARFCQRTSETGQLANKLTGYEIRQTDGGVPGARIRAPAKSSSPVSFSWDALSKTWNRYARTARRYSIDWDARHETSVDANTKYRRPGSSSARDQEKSAAPRPGNQRADDQYHDSIRSQPFPEQIGEIAASPGVPVITRRRNINAGRQPACRPIPQRERSRQV
jgi:hypothetical protein